MMRLFQRRLQMKLFLRSKHFVLLAGSLLLFVCNGSVGRANPQGPDGIFVHGGLTPAPKSTPEPRNPNIVLSEIVEASSIRIEDRWSGLSKITPVSSVWELQMFDEYRSPIGRIPLEGFSGLAGTVIFRAQPRSPMRRRPPRPDLQGPGVSGKVFFKTADVFVPVEHAKYFLKILSRVHLVRGEYVPRIQWTDDFPSITIKITTWDSGVSETITFFTQSQGKGHVPWGVTIQGVTYVVPSDRPDKALEALEPHLRRNILKDLTDNLKNSEPLPPSPFDIVTVSRYRENIYQDDRSGKLIQTEDCHKDSDPEEAILKYERDSHSNKLIFEDGTICDVKSLF